jgi:16S rRNA (uracil1498-N3)-methyltransferase
LEFLYIKEERIPMRRFFVEKFIRTADGSCVIRGSEAMHILKVLRMSRGDRFILMDRAGDRHEAEIESIDGREVIVRLAEKMEGPASSYLEITLCPAILKSGPMDYLIEKTSELGITRILPFYSERSVIKINDSNASNKVRRWREIAVSSAKQSDRITPAEISEPVAFKDAVKRWQDSKALQVILWEREDSRDLKELLKKSMPGRHFVGMVGPEGGFSALEVDAAAQAGFIPVSLGRRVLRAETAAMTMVAIVQYEWGDLSLQGVID